MASALAPTENIRPFNTMDGDYDYTDPERSYKGLIQAVNGGYPTNTPKSERAIFQTPQPPLELCPTCGWNSEHQLASGYISRVKVLYSRRNQCYWAIGSRWIIRDQPKNLQGNDGITQEYLRNIPTLEIPLLKSMQRLSTPDDQIQFTLMPKLQGQPLRQLWPSLTDADKQKYAKELGSYIRIWRSIQSPTIRKTNHEQLDDIILGWCSRRKHPPSCKKIGYTIEAWLDNLAPEIRSGIGKLHSNWTPDEVEDHFQSLRANFSTGFPNVLTHGDLHLDNIFVKDGQIEAIIDWEVAGFYPSWVESFLFTSWEENTTELHTLLRQDGCVDFSLQDLQEQILPGIKPICDAWKACRIEHPNEDMLWIKPGFCTCRNYGGKIDWTDLGLEPIHKIID